MGSSSRNPLASNLANSLSKSSRPRTSNWVSIQLASSICFCRASGRACLVLLLNWSGVPSGHIMLCNPSSVRVFILDFIFSTHCENRKSILASVPTDRSLAKESLTESSSRSCINSISILFSRRARALWSKTFPTGESGPPLRTHCRRRAAIISSRFTSSLLPKPSGVALVMPSSWKVTALSIESFQRSSAIKSLKGYDMEQLYGSLFPHSQRSILASSFRLGSSH
mmetsp:Transcript_13605/g.29981  ORF Transcript_13605/g.29981 Transcript_13605/m.29981 type:complete len:226 (-) Transcript_13605:702-1379(-)